MTNTGNTVTSVDPATGDEVVTIERSSAAEVERVAGAAAAAAPELDRRGRGFRAAMLRAVAARLEERRAEIVALGMRETGLGEARLGGELTRTAYQAEFFADVIEDGGYLEVAVDHAADTPMGPGPDLRRMLVPIGPVAVFGASNFPLAFSVPGGDTVSALAAGCPVVVKAHGSHPGLSRLAHDAIALAVADVDGPDGTIGIVYGTEAGAALVAAPQIAAVGFTGSQSGGQALLDIIATREVPIPFFGELSSLNPFVIAPAAASARGTEIAAGLIASVTGSGGQLCTKPGLAFVPTGAAGDRVVAEMARLVSEQPAHPLLNRRIADAYDEIGERLVAADGASMAATGSAAPAVGSAGAARLIAVEHGGLTAALAEECFGPTVVVARYADVAELRSGIALLPPSLTATVHRSAEDEPLVREIVAALLPLAGRLVFDQYPTGVLVSWAQHHGGPWPATNTQHTSVGATAIRRFLRPVVWQNAPVGLLPAELRDDAAVPRRVDGLLAH